MHFKTILVYLPFPDRVSQIMSAVIPLAERHDAHVIGLHIMAEAPVYGLIEAEIYADMANQQRAARLQEAQSVEAAFNEARKTTSLTMEWRCQDVPYSVFETHLAEQARLADLVVVSQKENDPLDAWSDLPTKLILDTGRPVLVVPRTGTFASIGKSVIVAWNGTRESARAAFDAIPMMHNADAVKVLAINPPDSTKKESFTPSDDLCLSLSRHGINAEAVATTAPDISVPAELLSRAADYGSDLIVMGCYGHSRIRETIFGGATREMMQTMSVPVLMSH